MEERFVDWFRTVTDKKWIVYFLGVIAFLESIIFPIPVDIFIFTLAAVHPKKWVKYGSVATFWSVLGAVGGYFLGMFLFDAFGQQMIAFYGYEQEFAKVTELFNDNVFLVMFTAAFTPIPYKVFTIAGGALNVALAPFVIASILGRGLRFFAETYIPYRFGEKIGKHIFNNLNKYTFVVLVFIVLFFIAKYTIL